MIEIETRPSLLVIFNRYFLRRKLKQCCVEREKDRSVFPIKERKRKRKRGKRKKEEKLKRLLRRWLATCQNQLFLLGLTDGTLTLDTYLNPSSGTSLDGSRWMDPDLPSGCLRRNVFLPRVASPTYSSDGSDLKSNLSFSIPIYTKHWIIIIWYFNSNFCNR